MAEGLAALAKATQRSLITFLSRHVHAEYDHTTVPRNVCQAWTVGPAEAIAQLSLS